MADAERNGYLKLSRKQFRKPDDGGCAWWNEPRTYSRWEAWQDLIQSAAWRAHEVLVGNAAVKISRGETPPRSIRFLANRWGWSRKKVELFVALGESMGRFSRHQRTREGDTVIIENYNLYQASGDSSETVGRRQPGRETARGTARDTKGRQQRDSKGDRETSGTVEVTVCQETAKRRQGRQQRDSKGDSKGDKAEGTKEPKKGKEEQQLTTALSVPLPGTDRGPKGEKTAATHAVSQVWECYLDCHRQHHGKKNGQRPPPPKLTAPRRQLILQRLRDGYPPDEQCRAVRGMFATPHNLGQNDRGREYLGLEIALRVNREQNNLERFRDSPDTRAVQGRGGIPYDSRPSSDPDRPGTHHLGGSREVSERARQLTEAGLRQKRSHER